MNILEIKDLSIDFCSNEQKKNIIDKISFSIKKGETLGVVGESGSGKSITSLSIMNLLPQQTQISSGSIKFFNQEKEEWINLVTTKDNYRGHYISMIFQEPMTSLNPSKRCGKQIEEVILTHQKCNHKDAKRKTLELLTRVKIPDIHKAYRAYPHELSGGQKQRIMIAIAISCNPSILIADEPTTALDVTVQKNIIELLKELQKEFGMSILFISHDLGVISKIADRVIVMYKGKIVEENDTNAIFQNPQHPYTKGLIACKPSMDTRLKVLPIINDFLSNKDISYEIEDINQRKQKQAYIYSTEPIIKVRDLELNFIIKKSWTGKILKSYSALKKISFDVYENEVLGLVGESGCGKTTLGRTLLKLLDPTGGEIYYNNIPAIKMTKEQMKDFRKNFQIIFQDPYSSLNPYLTIGSTIIEPMIVHNILENDKQRKEKVIYLLERVGLKADYYYRYPHEFSGGQRQRICIARTLSMSPKFIICDESVSALDVSVQAQVLNLLNELKQDFNFTYIFISHDLSVVKFMSDRIIVMNQGKIEEADFADEIYLHPKTEYTKKLISAIPHIKLDKNNKY